MSAAEQIYLTAAIAAFIFFGTTLFSIYVWTGMEPKAGRPARKPLALLAGALAVSLACAAMIGQTARQAADAPAAPRLTASR